MCSSCLQGSANEFQSHLGKVFPCTKYLPIEKLVLLIELTFGFISFHLLPSSSLFYLGGRYLLMTAATCGDTQLEGNIFLARSSGVPE